MSSKGTLLNKRCNIASQVFSLFKLRLSEARINKLVTSTIVKQRFVLPPDVEVVVMPCPLSNSLRLWSLGMIKVRSTIVCILVLF